MTLPDFKGQFMPTIIPASPGTYIIEIGESGAVLRTPLVAWAPDADNPYKAPHPITVDGLSRLVSGRAVLFPCGMVHSRDHAICFTGEDEWLVVAEKGPRTAEPPERPTEPAKSVKTSKPAAKSDTTELKIEWITKPFKTNSFYRYTDGEIDFIFQIEGGVNPPKQKAPITKIKRDEFVTLKKTVDVAEVDELLEGRAPGIDDVGSFADDVDSMLGDDEDDDLI
jgi:hypothetical protein